VAVSPDGGSIATGHWDGTIRIWRAGDRELLASFPGYALVLQFSPDGSMLLSCPANAATLRRVSDGSVVRAFEGYAQTAAISPDAKWVLVGGWSPELRRVSDGGLERTLSGLFGGPVAVAFSPDSSRVLVGTTEGDASVFRVSDGALMGWFTVGGSIRSVAFSPDGTLAAAASERGYAKVWRVSEGTLVSTLSGHTGPVFSVAFSPDGSLALTGASGNIGGDQTAKLWRISDGTLLRTFVAHRDGVFSVAFSPDGMQAVTGAWDGVVLTWDVSDLVPKPAPVLNIQQTAGKIQVSWTGGGTLEQADKVQGAYQPVPAQTNPYEIEPLGSSFFRVAR
jgi:WD40 repeat protein